MLIYEKENKLNINFDNEVSEQPDLQISKEDGKTEVLIDGQPSGGSGGMVEPVIVTLTRTSETAGTWSGATWEELTNAFMHGSAFVADEIMLYPISAAQVGEDNSIKFLSVISTFVSIGTQTVDTNVIALTADNSVFLQHEVYPRT